MRAHEQTESGPGASMVRTRRTVEFEAKGLTRVGAGIVAAIGVLGTAGLIGAGISDSLLWFAGLLLAVPLTLVVGGVAFRGRMGIPLGETVKRTSPQ